MADIITNVGLAADANLLSGLGGTVAKYAQMGTGTNAPAVTDTALQTPTNDARVSGTVTLATTTAANDTVQVAATITSGAGGAITEFGLWSSAGTGTPATGGILNCRSTFSVINLNSGDSITFTASKVLS